MAKVIIDAGHGGYDNGAVYQGRQEKDDNLDIALAVGEILNENGVEVAYTRVDDVYQSPVQKAQAANEIGGDYFISIHRNSSPTPNTYSGVQTLIYDENGVKADMAENINQELSKVGFPNLGISLRKNLAVLRRTEMPALLVEVGFLNTDADNALLDAEFEAAVAAIANGILGALEGSGQLFPSESTDRETVYRVQVGLFRNPDNARRLTDEIRALGYPVVIEMYGNLYAVRVGATDVLEEAASLERQLNRFGYETLIVTQ